MTITIHSASDALNGRRSAQISFTDNSGVHHDRVRYLYDPADPYGMSPDVGVALEAWVEAGNEIEPHPDPVPVEPETET